MKVQKERPQEGTEEKCQLSISGKFWKPSRELV